MKKTAEKVLSVLIVSIMLLGILPIVPFTVISKASEMPASGTCGENVAYSFEEDTGVLTISGTGDMVNYYLGKSPFYNNEVIEKVIIEKGVTSIGNNSFDQCKKITSINIPYGIKTIGYNAFSHCEDLKNIAIPSTVTKIGSNAFSSCSSITDLVLPKGIEYIYDRTFDGCSSLTSITIPEGVKSIGEFAFYGCKNLTSVNIPNSVTGIGPNCFWGCESLASVELSESLTSISKWAFADCKNLTDVLIPIGVKSIGEFAFYNCAKLVDVTLPDSAADIQKNAFNGCKSITDITLPTELANIGEAAFYGCSALKSITIHSNLTSVAYNAFFFCNRLKDVYYYDNETKWSQITFGKDNDCLTAATIHYIYSPKFTVDSTEAMSGGVVEIPVRIYNNSGLKGFSTTISYNSTALTPIEVKKGAAFNAGSIVSNLEKLTPGELNVVGYSARTSTENDVLYTVVFKVSDGAKGSYALKISYDSDNTYDGDMEDITAQCEDGLIDVMQSSSAKTLLYVENQTVICGDKVNIPIKIKYQNGLESISFNLKYDNTVLDFVSVSSDVAEVSCTSNNGSATINVTSLKECSDEKVIAYVSMKTKAIAQAVITMTSNDDINLLNGVVTVKDDLSVKPTIYSDNAIGKINTTVAVPICIKNNPGIAGYKIKISFDPTALSPESIKDGEFYQGEYNNLGFKSGEIAVIWINIHGTDIQENGEIFTVNFKVLKEGVHNVSVTYSKADTFDEKSEELELICNSGKIFACDLLLPKKDKNTVVDNSNKFVYGLDAGLKTITSYAYAGDGFTISETAGKLAFGTSSKIDVMYEKDVAATYTIVLFGDVNGDGWYDGQDAVMVNMIANGMLTREQVGEAVWMAADCNHDGKIDQSDVDLLNQAGVLLSSVDQTKQTEELLETSSEYKEYLNLIDQRVESENNEPEQESPETQNPSLPEFLLTTIWNYIKLILSLIK